MTYGIALGSNLGDRLRNLQDAARELLHSPLGVQLLAVAPLYETAPVDCPEGSQSFLNTVIEVSAPLEPATMLQELHRIEEHLGRPNDHAYHAPRTVDLDLLYANDILLQQPDLTLPHPRLHLRRFVLQPLADIRPTLRLPGQDKDVATLLAALTSSEPPLLLLTNDWMPDEIRVHA